MGTTPPPPTPPEPPPPPPFVGGSGGSEPGSRPLASPGTRVLARILDWLILMVVNLIVFAISLSGDTGTVGGVGSDMSTGTLMVAALISLAIGFVWDPLFTKSKGGTPMKLAFGMNVVRADDGGPVEWRHAIIRWGVLAVWGIVPILGLFVPLILIIVSLGFILTRPLRQAVWDLTAKTIVVEAR